MICDAVNYANLDVEGAAIISEYSKSESSFGLINFEVDQDQTYYLVFDARDQTDPDTFSYGFDIKEPLVDTDDSADDTDDAGSTNTTLPGYPILMVGIISLLAIYFKVKSKKRD
ncbi:MAG: hypothetical protein ACTSVZ_10100 [Promethearchaeota archaeon]